MEQTQLKFLYGPESSTEFSWGSVYCWTRPRWISKGSATPLVTVRAWSKNLKPVLCKFSCCKKQCSNSLMSIYSPLAVNVRRGLTVNSSCSVCSCSLNLQQHCTSWAQRNNISSLLMEAIHHIDFRGYTPDLCSTVSPPDLTPCPPSVLDLLQVSFCIWLANVY